MSTQGASPCESIVNSAVSHGKFGNSEHQATIIKPTALAHHLKQPSNVIADHHTDETNPATKTDTKMLHEGQNGQPTITLTVYEKEDSPGQSVLSITNAISDSYAEGKQPHQLNDKLKSQLEDYFQGLKSEFEAKTGREWDPLRAWPAEEWEWEWDDEEP